MRKSCLWAALSFAVLVLPAVPAFADDCGPLQELASLDLTTGPGGSLLVPVSINGTPEQLTLATAAGLTSVAQNTVSALKLHTAQSNMTLLSSNGDMSNRFVHLDTFQIGGATVENMALMVSPGPDDANSPVGGTFAGDLISRFDVEINFTDHKLNLFSKNHCAGHVIYWPASAVAVVPFTTQRPLQGDPAVHTGLTNYDYHIHVPVTIDGKEFLADINTASPTSTMSTQTAKYVFGITADSPGSVVLGKAPADPDRRVFGHVFGSLGFEGIAVTNPHFIIAPDLTGTKDPDNGLVTGSHITRIDETMRREQITLGLDILKHLRLYVAYSERKLYLTPATEPTVATSPKP